MRQQLAKWALVQTTRRGAEDGLARDHARVSWCDYRLDRAVKLFANELLRDAEGRTDDTAFRAIFPEAPGEVVRMGLEAEIERCEALVTVAARATLSKTAAGRLEQVRTAMKTGRLALKARRTAYLTQASASLDVAAWKEAADAIRASSDVQVQAWALENGEDRDYADRFFPASNSTRAARNTNKPVEPDSRGGGARNPK